MDYINYVKQSPMQGMTGLWGGTQGALQQAAGGGAIQYAGGRALCSTYGSPEGVIGYWSLETTSNAGNFGSIPGNSSNNNGAFCGNAASRAVWGGGPSENAMVYVETATPGNSSTFGSLNQVRYAPAGCSNGPRGLIAAGSPNTASIDYSTVANTGTATDFGDRTQARHGIDSVSGGVRGIFANGQDPHSQVIDYVTIDTTGNASNFGNTTVGRTHGTGTNSDPGSGQNRGVFMAGYSGVDDHCDYITCSSTGNATDWGELAVGHSYRCGSGTNGLRGYCAGGEGSGTNAISYMTIDTTSSSTDAGDLTASGASQGCSGVAA